MANITNFYSPVKMNGVLTNRIRLDDEAWGNIEPSGTSCYTLYSIYSEYNCICRGVALHMDISGFKKCGKEKILTTSKMCKKILYETSRTFHPRKNDI